MPYQMPHGSALGAAVLSLWLASAQAQQGLPEIGTAVREERPVQMAENIYRRITAVHESLDDDPDGALERLGELTDMRLNAYEEAQVYQAYGFIYAQQGDYGRAIEAFERCIELDALPNIAQQNLLYGLAGLYQNEGRFQDAIDAMSTWFSYAGEPVPGEAFMIVGNSHAQLEQLQQALPYVREAIARAETPNESWYLLELAIHYELMDYSSAVEVLRRMVVLWPDNARYWETLASAYLELEDDSNALAALMVAYKHGMLEEEAKLINLARMNLFLELPYEAGQILETEIASGRVEATRENLELLLSAWTSAREYAKAVAVIDELAPLTDDGRYYLRKAQLLSEQAQWDEVAEAAAAALEADGLAEPGQTLILKGTAHAELGEYDQALAAFQEAREVDDSVRRNADAWIEYIRDRREAAPH